jgi:pimeloyl-ACP methyl ester carboxylesterase
MNKLLLLHGALGAASQFDPLIVELKKNQDVWAPDLPMHGYNQTKVEAEMTELVDYLIQQLDSKSWSQCNILGYSMGGYLALMLALKRPDLCHKVVTLGTKFNWDEAIGAQQAAMLNPEIMESKVASYAAYLNSLHKSYTWKEVVRFTSTLLVNLSQNPPLQQSNLSKINLPCVLCLGDADKMVTEDETLLVAKTIMQGSFKLIPNTPHPLEKVSPDILLRLCHEEFGI